MTSQEKIDQCVVEYIKRADLKDDETKLLPYPSILKSKGFQDLLNSNDLKARENAWIMYIRGVSNKVVKFRKDELLKTLDMGADLWSDVMDLVESGEMNKNDILPFFKHQNHRVRIGPWSNVKIGRITQADLKPFLDFYLELLKSNDLEVRAKAWSLVTVFDELRIVRKEQYGKYKAYLEEVLKDPRFLDDLEDTYLDLLDGITRKDFLPFLWNNDPRVRIATWWMISDSPDILELVEKKANVILDTLSYPDPKLRVLAWRVVRRLEGEGLIDAKSLDLKPLLELLRIPDLELRLEAWRVATSLAKRDDLSPYLDALRETVSREEVKESFYLNLRVEEILASGKIPKSDVLYALKFLSFDLWHFISKLKVEDVEELLMEGDEDVWYYVSKLKKDGSFAMMRKSWRERFREMVRRYMTHEDLRVRALAWSFLFWFLPKDEVKSLQDYLKPLLTAGDEAVEIPAWRAVVKLHKVIDPSVWSEHSRRALTKLETMWYVALKLLSINVLSPSDFLEIKDKVINMAKTEMVHPAEVQLLMSKNVINQSDLWKIVTETQNLDVAIAVWEAYPEMFVNEPEMGAEAFLRFCDKGDLRRMKTVLSIVLPLVNQGRNRA